MLSHDNYAYRIERNFDKARGFYTKVVRFAGGSVLCRSGSASSTRYKNILLQRRLILTRPRILREDQPKLFTFVAILGCGCSRQEKKYQEGSSFPTNHT